MRHSLLSSIDQCRLLHLFDNRNSNQSLFKTLLEYILYIFILICQYTYLLAIPNVQASLIWGKKLNMVFFPIFSLFHPFFSVFFTPIRHYCEYCDWFQSSFRAISEQFQSSNIGIQYITLIDQTFY